jgi:hypothetical protein
MRHQKKVRSIPFDFVIEALDQINPHTKPMFGCTAVYVDDKIMFVLRDRENHVGDNGVWVATTPDNHKSLQKEFPSMRSLQMFGPGKTGWQVLPADSDDFEDSVLKACSFVLGNDPRIGKIPKNKISKGLKKSRSKK